MIKYKTSVCAKCLNGMEVPLISRLCQYHYRKQMQEKSLSRQAGKAKKPVKIKPMSAKRQKESKEYSKRRIEFLTKNDVCEAKLPGCTWSSTEVHHSQGRTGSNYLDVSTWKALCHNCHEQVERKPLMAKELGLSYSRLSKAS